MNPLVESKSECSGDAGEMSSLTSEQTEERLKEALQHCATRADEYQLPIPLKRVDSGPRQHHIQEPESAAGFQAQTTDNNAVHRGLLDEIDVGPNMETKVKTDKKSNTLTKMWKGIRVDKSKQDGSDDKMEARGSISKIFKRINPVGKVSRDNFSKVFHRIGDALQKRSEGEVFSTAQSQPLDNRDSQSEFAKCELGEKKNLKIGEKNFRCRPSNTDASKISTA